MKSFRLKSRIQIVPFEDRYAPDFERLNREWLEGYGLLEPADERYIRSPREAIIEPGGQIFFAVHGKRVVGTCSIIPRGEFTAELAKLAVTARARRKGIGKQLAAKAINHGKSVGVQKMFLSSSSRLESAIRLYESLGFCHRPLPPDLEYENCDVYMELEI